MLIGFEHRVCIHQMTNVTTPKILKVSTDNIKTFDDT